MKTNIQIFTSDVFGEIRTCQVNNQIMFVGKDVATALGYANTLKAIRDHVDSEDKGVNEMVTPGGTQAYGWRAAFVLLTRTYYHTYRLYTIRAIVTKWAPPNENATAAYIRSVALQTGIDPDEPLGIPSEKPARWMMLAWAMAIQECGEQGLSIFQMLQGWQMARA